MIEGFKIEEIKSNYPKSYIKLEEYFGAQLDKVRAEQELPSEFTTEWTVNLNLTHGWKGLVYFFDTHKVYITFNVDNEQFTFNIICKNRKPLTQKTFNTRIDCEFEAISEAFKTLEENI